MRTAGVAALCMCAMLSFGQGREPGTPGGNPPQSAENASIHVDIPVVIEKADVVFNMAHPEFSGDMPVGINYMRLLAERFRDMKTEGKIIGVFHADAAYMTLNDRAYNAYRKVTTGNPYREMITGVIAQGVQIEECAVSMKNHGWINADLLPGVKVNQGAIGRLVQLVRSGYVQIIP